MKNQLVSLEKYVLTFIINDILTNVITVLKYSLHLLPKIFLTHTFYGIFDYDTFEFVSHW